jgi:hypothetical protein
MFYSTARIGYAAAKPHGKDGRKKKGVVEPIREVNHSVQVLYTSYSVAVTLVSVT